MTEISNLNNSFNIEEVVKELFELIKQKDITKLNYLYNICIENSKKISAINIEDVNFIDTYAKLESYSNDLTQLTEIFSLLDEKLNNEIKNNQSLSKDDKEELQNDFLFNIRQKRLDIFTMKNQCQATLSVVEKELNDKNDAIKDNKKSPFLPKIQAIRNHFTDKESIKNKLN